MAGERVEKIMNFLNNLVPPEKRPMHSWDLSFFLFSPHLDRFEPIVYSFLGFGPQTLGSLGLGLWGEDR